MIKIYLQLGLIGLYFGVSLSASAQQLILRGKVLMENEDTGVPYVTIGILNSNIGVYSQENGEFQIEFPLQYLKDTIQFSCIGYQSLKMALNKLSQKETNTIRLSTKTVEIEEVIVTPKKKFQVIGLEKGNSGMILFNESLYSGEAVAIKLQSSRVPFQINKGALRFYDNQLEPFIARIRIMSVDSVTGLPKDDLINQNVYQKTTRKKGWLEFNLEEYEVWLWEDNFFICFEWILTPEYRKKNMESARKKTSNILQPSFQFEPSTSQDLYLRMFNNQEWSRRSGELVARVWLEY